MKRIFILFLLFFSFFRHSDTDHLRIIEKVIGRIPRKLAVGEFFDSDGKILINSDFDRVNDDRKNWPLEVNFQYLIIYHNLGCN